MRASAHARADEPVLPVAVGGLVQVHEVHVNAVPGDVAVELGVQVQQRLAQFGQPGDPHLGRGERVHPGDQPGAGVVGIGFAAQVADRVRVGQDRLEDDCDGDCGIAVQPCGDLLGVLRHLLQRFRAIQVLAAGDKPESVVFQFGHDGRSFDKLRPHYSVLPVRVSSNKASCRDKAKRRPSVRKQRGACT